MSEREYIQQFGRALRKPPVAMVGEYSGETYCGLPIIINDALCKQKVPVRKHNDRGERRRNRFFARPFKHTPSAYHLRIQKKWNKRFGMQDSDVFYMTPHAAIMSSAAYDKFCKAVTR